MRIRKIRHSRHSVISAYGSTAYAMTVFQQSVTSVTESVIPMRHRPVFAFSRTQKNALERAPTRATHAEIRPCVAREIRAAHDTSLYVRAECLL